MAILSNQRRGAGMSRHNFKDDMGLLMGWLEHQRAPQDDDEQNIRIEGWIELATVNRLRALLGMPPLEAGKR